MNKKTFGEELVQSANEALAIAKGESKPAGIKPASVEDLKIFDAADYLDSEEMIAAFLEASNEWDHGETPPEGAKLQEYRADVEDIVNRARARLKDRK